MYTQTATAQKPARLVRHGDIVDYVLPTGRNMDQHRPAMVVKVWDTPTETDTPAVQLQTFTDGTNDYDYGQPGALTGLIWATSVHHDEAEKRPGTWHWPEKEE